MLLEFYYKAGGILSSYVDYPVTDILQMVGKANRPMIDDVGMFMIFAS